MDEQVVSNPANDADSVAVSGPGYPAFRFGHVAIVGRPNVGKSTLLNRLVGTRVSITSRKPQTTWHRIVGIHNTETAQLAYVDTPGMHRRTDKSRNRALNRQLNRTAEGALAGVDAVVLVVEALRWVEDDALSCERARSSGVPLVLAINKVDRISKKSQLLPFIEQCSEQADFADVFPLSARQGDNVLSLEHALVQMMPAGPALYPDDQFTDRSLRFMAAELIREQLIRLLGDELPHRLTVQIEAFDESSPTLARVSALIWVEKASHKPIVVGRGGDMLKKAGTSARIRLEELLGHKVHLQLWVKVHQSWSDDVNALRRLGFEE